MGEMTQDACDRAQNKVNNSFDAIEIEKVRDALLAGKNNMFGKKLGGSDGVDEGLACL